MVIQNGEGRVQTASDVRRPNPTVCDTTLRIVLVSLFPEHLSDMTQYLSKNCCDVFIAHKVDLKIMRAMQPDVVILDHTIAVPISCKSDADEIEGLTAVYLFPREVDLNQLGLNPNVEVILYPVNYSELLFRLRTLHRQQRFPFQSERNHRISKDLTINYDQKQVWLKNVPLDVTKSEFHILWILVESNGAALTREEIMNKVWGEQYFSGSNTIDVHIRGLRKKLKEDINNPQYIETVRGVGYRLSV